MLRRYAPQHDKNLVPAFSHTLLENARSRACPCIFVGMAGQTVLLSEGRPRVFGTALRQVTRLLP